MFLTATRSPNRWPGLTPERWPIRASASTAIFAEGPLALRRRSCPTRRTAPSVTRQLDPAQVVDVNDARRVVEAIGARQSPEHAARPISNKAAGCRAFTKSMLSRQRTGSTRFRAVQARMRSGSVSSAAVRLNTTGTAGARKAIGRSHSAKARCAVPISALCQGPATGSLRHVPKRSAATKRAARPARTIRLRARAGGELSLAVPGVREASWSAIRADAPVAGLTATIPPASLAAASSIKRPRSAASATASSAEMMPAAARAVTSPSEWQDRSGRTPHSVSCRK